VRAQRAGPRPFARRRRLYSNNAELAETERVVSYLRTFVAVIVFAAIYFDPPEPDQYAAFTHVLVTGYVMYSVAVIALTRLGRPASSRQSLLLHAIDVLAAAVLTLFTEGPNSPLFVTFGFTLLAAGFRWGLWETLDTGIISAFVYFVEALLVGKSSLSGGLIEGAFHLNQFIIRLTYLLLFALIVGYFAEQQKISRAALAEIAAAAERARLGRELHDGITQSLIGIRMRLEVLRRAAESDAAIAAEVRRSESVLNAEITNLRTMMFELAPLDASDGDLRALLDDLLDRFQHASGISARLVAPDRLPPLSSRTCREIGRIVQEALVNAQKHSGAETVVVTLAAERRHWRLTVEDDGRGFEFDGRLTHDRLDREHKGPRVLKERVRLLGGTLDIDSQRGRGAVLQVVLPFIV
jgi:signal transduction histidine kinase